MPQSLVKNYIHIVFSTKRRYPFIDEHIKSELFSYLIVVGGYVDHIHILCLLSRKIALMNLIEELKSHSSKWIKSKGKQYENFYWQNGYGGFSVKPSDVNVVTNYIQKQEEHHKNLPFKEEYKNFLNNYNIEYDERYVWD
jgi:REP element-mobilizing transposase RayT